jgi:N-acyl-D-aspartate/D-glutamate deacylase
MDSSIHTYFLSLGEGKKAFSLEEAIRMITLAPAVAWDFARRGLLREGLVVDINIFDPDTIAPAVPAVEADLPGGGTRLAQASQGIRSTIVASEALISEGRHTGAFPGRLLRRSSPAFRPSTRSR